MGELMSGPQSVGIQVGGNVDRQLAEAVIQVATCSPVPKVAIKALEVFAQIGKVEGVTVSNCTIGATPPAPPVFGGDFDGWAE
jgi:hypothetical protein